MDVRDFDFHLPPELIAQEPARERVAARLLCLDRRSGAIRHMQVADLPALLSPGDLVVVNNTRVFPARLLGRRVPSGGAVECLLVRRIDPAEAGSFRPRGSSVREDPRESCVREDPASGGLIETLAGSHVWEALVHPGQKLKPGARVVFEGPTPIHGEILDRRFFGRRLVKLWTGDGSPLDAAVDAIGHVPLPPYIKRGDAAADRERYQTVFARERGSIAAPTAGLHFTDALAAAVRARGVEIVEITLHVGYGTFQPVRVERVEDHRVEPERYDIAPDVAHAINRAIDDRRRVVAVGTTTTRTLEAVAKAHEGRLAAGGGETDLFIYPGFDFRVVSALMTNFHLPHSSLLMLVAAFAGRERVLRAYEEAVRERYRFYSYGDAMLIV